MCGLNSDSTFDASSENGRPRFLSIEETITKRNANLPHWEQGEVCVFVTFRLADSIPESKLGQWREERDDWLARHPQPWNEEEKSEYLAEFGNVLEKWLDDGLGSCVLRYPNNRELVCNALNHFDGMRYILYAFAVMPNHVHALFSPIGDFSVSQTLHSWKSFTAHKVQRANGDSGPFWQKESWDRLIRDNRYFANVVKYIARNPRHAGGMGYAYVRPDLQYMVGEL